MPTEAKAIHVKLSELASTAIAGNDILSSCLYVSGIAILYAGAYAPFVFFAIVLVLYFYKHVYTEVVEALPLNGGAYNCLLNATSKSPAAIAGVMTILSYVATSVISAKTASAYLHTVLLGVPVIPLTAAIIIFFTILTILGVKDSAKVAQVIFGVHIFTILVLVSFGLISIINLGWGRIPENLALTNQLFAEQGAAKLLFLAFAASLLGVSGFESSANFVEEQKPGVFRNTLRNMLMGVWVFNPLITFVVLASLNLGAIASAKDFVLASAAFELGGRGLQYLVVIDAFLVLSGAVLASFVGATGLLYRMTLDHCLPSSVLLPKLKARNQNTHRIVVAFGLLCLSILVVTKGELLSLAGVYTISFLGVMTFFAIGNLILRQTRADLKRTYQGPMIFVILAALATIAGIVGNILIDPKNVWYFAMYFVPAVILVQSMIYRDYILETLLKISRYWPWLNKLAEGWFEHVIRPKIILFTHNPEKLYASLEYIQRNEASRHIIVVFCQNQTLIAKNWTQTIAEYLRFFKSAKIFKNLEIELMV
ncbi:MAG TPA: amino acid permease, partial [Candidatus Pacebacteria bacterium]|nr:amino acid permease [Candidatus Paceibacterota bacterium]